VERRAQRWSDGPAAERRAQRPGSEPGGRARPYRTASDAWLFSWCFSPGQTPVK
jgi:hypothetical protein